MTNGAASGLPRVVVVGPLPPPTHGHMVVTQRVLTSPILRERFTILHVDISDHSDLDGIGRWSARNAWLGIVHAGRLLRTLSRRRPDLVYLPLSQNRLGLVRDCVLLAVCIQHRVKVVGHVHGGGFGRFLASSPAWFSGPVRWLIGRCALLIVMSHQQGEDVRRVFPQARVDVLPHGSRVLDERPRPRVDCLRVIYVSSSLSSSKGTFVTLRAARLVAGDAVPVRWTIVGPWRNAEAQAEGRKIVEGLDNVDFTGAVEQEQLEDLYQQNDVFVFPTGSKEGFGMVRIEAMAAGLPVVTTPAGGGAEIVGDAGVIVPYDSPEELAQQVRLLHQDRALLDTLSARARSRHTQLFSEARFEEGLAASWSAASASEAASQAVSKPASEPVP